MTPATKHLYDPRLPAGTAEHLCDDHAVEALDERPDDGLVVTPAPPGATCDRCAQMAPAPLDLDAIEARVKAASPEPWDHLGQDHAVIIGRDNVAFVDHAPSDIPALVAEVRRLRVAQHHTVACLGRALRLVQCLRSRDRGL